MILVTRINKVEQFYINEDHIEFMEETPDTIISMDTGKKVIVMEPVAEVIERIIEQKRKYIYFNAVRDGRVCDEFTGEAGGRTK